MQKFVATLLLTLMLAAGAGFRAEAHKVVAGAYASGDRIEGEIGFSDGAMAKNTLVEVLAEDGGKLGETRTGEDGSFVFVPNRRVLHIFRADLGGGHVAEIRLDVAELPTPLSTTTGDTAASGAVISAPTPVAPGDAGPKIAAQGSVAISDDERAVLIEAVRNEIKPLRRELIALKEKNDLQAILGGIGYIAGLFGLWFFLAARRRNKQAG